jgi:hypothetical protein
MLRIALILIAIGSLSAAGTASASPGARMTSPQRAARFSGKDNTTLMPASPEWQSWIARSQAPTPRATIQIESDAICLGGVPGCSIGPAEGFAGWGVYAHDRDDFYFELGHIFDWSMLTNPDRAFLARKWGVPRWHWSDSERAIEAGATAGVGIEDGVEGIFAAVYQDCAWGHNTVGVSYTELVPLGLHVSVPSIGTGSFDTCAYIQRVAAR